MAPSGVTKAQIEAAKRLHDRLDGWVLTDQVFAEVRRAYPSNTDPKSALLKATLIDRLYATNVFAINAAVRHIVETFVNRPPNTDGRELVSRLARFPVGGRTHTSFASKYAHFFFDDSLPILDTYAARMLAIHLVVPQTHIRRWTADYGLYCKNIDELLALSEVTPTARELDHYLWLAGLWISFRRGKTKINAEARGLFASQDPDLLIAFVNLTG